MKTLQLSAIALCLFGMFSSCTKDTLSSQDSLANSKKSSEPIVQPLGKDVEPALKIVFTNSKNEIITEAIKGQPVTVTGIFNPAEGELAPTCGLLILEEETAPDVWTPLVIGKDENDKNVKEVLVTEDVQSISYTFTPDQTGTPAHNFRIHYKDNSGGSDGKCAGFKNTHSDEYGLNVVEACLPLNLVVDDVKGTPRESSDIYDFEVTYRVTSCPELGWAKLQGGLTAVTGFDASGLSSSDKAETTKGKERKLTNNNNHIIQWDFLMGQDYDHTFTVKFSKELKGEGPHQITGGWSVSAKDPETGDDIKVEVDPVVFEK